MKILSQNKRTTVSNKRTEPYTSEASTTEGVNILITQQNLFVTDNFAIYLNADFILILEDNDKDKTKHSLC